MKEYPSISPEIIRSADVYAFDKLDGSNIRAEWSRKKGFYKFGTRHRLLDRDEPMLGRAVGLIEGFEGIQEVLRDLRRESAVCFFEFWGPGSFAGNHDANDVHQVTLLDIAPFKMGILMPKDFMDLCGHLRVPVTLYRGRVGPQVEEQVRSGQLPGMTFEGIVCKGPNKATSMPLMFKVKSRAWLERLKGECKSDEEFKRRA